MGCGYQNDLGRLGLPYTSISESLVLPVAELAQIIYQHFLFCRHHSFPLRQLFQRWESLFRELGDIVSWR